MNNDEVHRKQAYQRAYSTHGYSPKALQWNNYQSAATRYKALVDRTVPSDKRILDAGCGMGDLLPFILAKGTPAHYLGVDITPEFIDIATNHYLGFDFMVANPFDSSFSRVFDIVYCCGVLNMGGDNWLEKRKGMISKLFSLCTNTLAFNMAG
jgi:SAM-dependent methyltransferase